MSVFWIFVSDFLSVLMSCWSSGDDDGLTVILVIEVLEECDVKFETWLEARGEVKDEDEGESFMPSVGDTDRNGCGKEIDGVMRLLTPLLLLLLLLLFLLLLLLLLLLLMLFEQVLELTMLALGLLPLDDFVFVCSCRMSGFQSGFMNEKSRNSSWLIALTIIGSIGVRIGSSDVKSLSKLFVSFSSF